MGRAPTDSKNRLLELEVATTLWTGNGYWVMDVRAVTIDATGKLSIMIGFPEDEREALAGSIKYKTVKPVGWRDK
jgi:hypothetical protein